MSPEREALRAAIAGYGARPLLIAADRTLDGGEVLSGVAERMRTLDAIGAQRVALALDNGADWVLWDLALLFGGKVCVPLPAFFSAAQQRHVLDSAGVDTLIGARHQPGTDADFIPARPGVSQRRPACSPALPAGTLKMTYTSGTTGQPKGVCLDGAAQLAVADAIAAVIRDCGVRHHLCVLPLATLLENVAGVYAPLLAGAGVELRPQAEIGLQGASGFDVGRFLARLGHSRPHSLILLPQLLLALVSAAERGLPLPAGLRFVAVGGGRVAPALLQRAAGLGLPVYEGYGLSECASVVCLNTPAAHRPGTVGKPLAHAEVRLAADGEVLVRGARMLGYLGEAPPAGDWLGTGDLGHLEDGFLVLRGRKKHQFITAFGRNVNPEWVEAELAQQPPIAQAWLHGEARAENLAVLVPRAAGCTDAELAAAVAAVNRTLPDYARAHRWLRADDAFTAANGLATTNGRLRRDALAAHYRHALNESPSPTACKDETSA